MAAVLRQDLLPSDGRIEFGFRTSLSVSAFPLIERAAAFFLLLHGAAGLHLRMRHTAFSLLL